MNRIKKILVIIVGLVGAGVAIFMLLGNDLEHIEDTNGADNYALQSITDEDIISLGTGSMGVGTKTNKISGMTEIYSEKFTGVYEVLYTNLLGKSDFLINIHAFEINGGNFKMVVVHNDEIVATLTPENADEYLLEDVSGKVSLVIAGESADFSFKMSNFDYDSFSHS